MTRTIYTGDNLRVLRGMNSDSVDLVYLDPPFNSDEDYQAPIGSEAKGAGFDDTWNWTKLDDTAEKQLAVSHPGVAAVIEAVHKVHGRSMSSYLVFMGLRLIELKRVLKDAGSIWLHCDDTADSYLRMLMDTIFGTAWFKNMVTWQRTKGKNSGHKFGRVQDRILYYRSPKGATFNKQWGDHDPEYVQRHYRHEDDLGRWRLGVLTGPRPSNGESGQPWRGVDPAHRHWSTPTQGGMAQFLKEHIPGWPDAFPGVHARLDALDEHGFVHWPKKEGGQPSLKQYLAASRGPAMSDLWTHINRLQSHSKEDTGYETQKPLALLELIIETSSNPGDLVLDPFCGCATTCVAAEKLGRRWIGIDKESGAYGLVRKRLKQLGKENLGALASEGVVRQRTTAPERTDQDPPIKNRQKLIDHLVAKYGEDCAYCGLKDIVKTGNFHIDHVVPKVMHGPDHQDNRKLCCVRCNGRKGTKGELEYMNQLRLARLQNELEGLS